MKTKMTKPIIDELGKFCSYKASKHIYNATGKVNRWLQKDIESLTNKMIEFLDKYPNLPTYSKNDKRRKAYDNWFKEREQLFKQQRKIGRSVANALEFLRKVTPLRYAVILLMLVLTFTSCKKQPMEKEVIKTVTVHDSVPYAVHDTTVVTQYDTVHVVAMDLVGQWKVYKVEDVNTGVSTYSNQTWKFNFTSTQIQENTSGGAGWDYVYNVTYGANYVDIFYTTSPTTYNLTAVGSEYRLTRVISASQSQIWYLKK